MIEDLRSKSVRDGAAIGTQDRGSLNTEVVVGRFLQEPTVVGHPWDSFKNFLQGSVFIEFEVVTRQLEDAITNNRTADRVLDDRAFDLARLRLVLIEAQVEAAPGHFLDKDGCPEYVMREAAKETARFWEWIQPRISYTAENLTQISAEELPRMERLALDVESCSWQGDYSMFQHARSARHHRGIFDPNPNFFNSGNVLAARELRSRASNDFGNERRGVAALARILDKE